MKNNDMENTFLSEKTISAAKEWLNSNPLGAVSVIIQTEIVTGFEKCPEIMKGSKTVLTTFEDSYFVLIPNTNLSKEIPFENLNEDFLFVL